MELRKAVQQQSSDKAAGADATDTAEVYKAGGGGLSMAEKLRELLDCM